MVQCEGTQPRGAQLHIAKEHDLPYSDFYQKYAKQSLPVVISGDEVAGFLPGGITLDLLVRTCGDTRVATYERHPGAHFGLEQNKFTVSLRDFVQSPSAGCQCCLCSCCLNGVSIPLLALTVPLLRYLRLVHRGELPPAAGQCDGALVHCRGPPAAPLGWEPAPGLALPAGGASGLRSQPNPSPGPSPSTQPPP